MVRLDIISTNKTVGSTVFGATTSANRLNKKSDRISGEPKRNKEQLTTSGITADR
jgi:hypothetical protein